MNMEPDEALSFIDFLFEKDAEDKIYLRWIVGPQFSFSLDEFKERLIPSPVRPDDEILEEVYGIIEKMGGEVNGNI